MQDYQINELCELEVMLVDAIDLDDIYAMRRIVAKVARVLGEIIDEIAPAHSDEEEG